MERKSIGSFISALRKANGLTQKSLAEKLNVSDKSVSRWERDDGAPDLSLIPVLAEIFGVTCDELLRGERQPVAQQLEQQDAERRSPKADKQKQRILAVSLSRYQNRSLVAVGLSIAGFLAAMVCNFGFDRAYIGFLSATAFYLAAIICQSIFINGAFLAVSDDETAGDNVERFKHHVVSLGEKAISFMAILLAISMPLITNPLDSHMGLTAEGWLPGAFIFGLACAALCGLVCYFVNSSLLQRKIYTLTEKETAIYQHNFNLKRTCTLILLAVLCVTFLGNAAATGGWNASIVATGTSFDDFNSFKAYMEQDIPAELGATHNSPTQPIPGNEHYFDAHGNEITKEESMKRTITDHDGNVVCEYIDRNRSVVSMRYGHMNGELLPITTFTYQEREAAQRTIDLRNAIFMCVYLVEIAAAFFVYFQKRLRLAQ